MDFGFEIGKMRIACRGGGREAGARRSRGTEVLCGEMLNEVILGVFYGCGGGPDLRRA